MRSEIDESDDRKVPPMTVAGHRIEDPLGVVLGYLTEHDGTVTHYDLFDGDRSRITVELIRATRSPWMGSRISAAEADWFIQQGASAPWDAVLPDADLVDADPLVSGGLYDQAEALYNHFFEAVPARVNVAKVSKVLHLMRPRLYPILDTRLSRCYRSAAKAVARQVGLARPELAHYRHMYWAAVQKDVVDNSSALATLRDAVGRSTGTPNAAEVAKTVGDVRLLDMMTWVL